MRKDNIHVLMLAGGLGTRLREVTGGNKPKCFVELKPGLRAIDYTLEQLQRVGITATWSADTYYSQYQEVLKDTDHRMLWQKPGGVIQAVLQPQDTILAIATDCIFPFKDLPEMIESHLPGTISWAVTRHDYANMDAYRGMDVVDNNVIVGRDDKSITRSPIVIIEPEVLKPYAVGEDLYFDTLPKVEEANKQRINEGKSSILNAFFLNGPVIDFGTPARLRLLRQQFQEVQHVIN